MVNLARSVPWYLVIPPVTALVLIGTWHRELGIAALIVVAAALIAAVLTAVHHAEIVAHRVGEPFGTLILAVAVTVIEVGLIIMLMTSAGEGPSSLARDTVFAAIMIVCNGVMGLCLLLGALRHGEVEFRVEGVTAALATLAAVATLALVLPFFTTSSPGPTFTGAQLAFDGVASLVLYGSFVFIQTRRHRQYFLPLKTREDRTAPLSDDDEEEHGDRPTTRATAISLGLLFLCLVVVVGLAKSAAPAIEHAVVAAGAPRAVVGVAIALLVLAPETVAAVRAARRNHIQTSFNLALGSALASIGLTIPVLALASIWLKNTLVLGLSPKDMVLLALTITITTLTVAPGRATLMQGAVHLTLFGVFLFLSLVP
ncbi:ionic transporter y4hA [Catellatospora sp. KI3]|uniref:calcium:proton antiporter n=1 Tax=Catellatospora sp. KI3 TaxID=3041620 RepID=UPI002482B198|nr:ionic transporter y4hA [Catellatospora sp. KI3]MDI1463568.1 ionic transporter y4hA [Catellatospora sp. KI3]